MTENKVMKEAHLRKKTDSKQKRQINTFYSAINTLICYMSFDLQILITPLVSSNSSHCLYQGVCKNTGFIHPLEV